MTDMDKKFTIECKLCPIEYKCTKRKYDCPFFMEGIYVKDFDPRADDFRALCSLCGKNRCDMRLEISKMFETAFGDDKVVYAKSRICPECIDKILNFINEEWGE